MMDFAMARHSREGGNPGNHAQRASSPRRRGPSDISTGVWIPAFAGMTPSVGNLK